MNVVKFNQWSCCCVFYLKLWKQKAKWSSSHAVDRGPLLHQRDHHHLPADALVIINSFGNYFLLILIFVFSQLRHSCVAKIIHGWYLEEVFVFVTIFSLEISLFTFLVGLSLLWRKTEGLDLLLWYRTEIIANVLFAFILNNFQLLFSFLWQLHSFFCYFWETNLSSKFFLELFQDLNQERELINVKREREREKTLNTTAPLSSSY